MGNSGFATRQADGGAQGTNDVVAVPADLLHALLGHPRPHGRRNIALALLVGRLLLLLLLMRATGALHFGHVPAILLGLARQVQFPVEFGVDALPGDLLQLVQRGPGATECVHRDWVMGDGRVPRWAPKTVLVCGEAALESFNLLCAVVPVQSTHPEVGQGVGAPVLEEEVSAALQVNDWKVAGRLVDVSVARHIVFVVFDNARHEALTLGVQVYSAGGNGVD